MKNRKLIFWAITSALAGFLFGFDTVVISGAERTFQELWQLDGFTHGMATSMALWGTVVGALLGGVVAKGGSVKLTSLKLNYLDRIWQGAVSWPAPETNLAAYPSIIEDTACSYSGPWSEAKESIYRGDTSRLSNQKDASFEATFKGNLIQWYGLKNTDLGYADVYLDGKLVADNIDCYSPKRAVQLLFEATNLVKRTHTIKVVVDGNKNAASGGSYLVHDYFEYK